MDKELFEKKVSEINDMLEKSFPLYSRFDKKIIESMRYSVMAGGKRLRPLIMQETYRMFKGEGTNEDTLQAFMTAIEYIHSYSLVHDDLPCMDDAERRRGKLTTHIKFGEEFGVLAGDALLNSAYEIIANKMARIRDPEELRCCVQALNVLAYDAGVHGMVGGQSLDVQSEKDDLEVGKNELDYIYDGKTAALIAASFVTGGILAGVRDNDIKNLEAVGKGVGIAFQIQDDILDATGDAKKLGKDTGSDEKSNKKTYVTFSGIEQAKIDVRRYTQSALGIYDSLECSGNKFLRDLIVYLIDRDK